MSAATLARPSSTVPELGTAIRAVLPGLPSSWGHDASVAAPARVAAPAPRPVAPLPAALERELRRMTVIAQLEATRRARRPVRHVVVAPVLRPVTPAPAA